MFYENIRSLAGATIASGVFMAPFGDDSTVIPLVAGDDVARVAAGVLTAADIPAGNSYSVIGQVLTVKEIVAAMARGLGREVAYQDVNDEVLGGGGQQPHQRPRRRAPVQAVGRLPHPFPGDEYEVTDTIEKLGGRKPEDVRRIRGRGELTFPAQAGR